MQIVAMYGAPPAFEARRQGAIRHFNRTPLARLLQTNQCSPLPTSRRKSLCQGDPPFAPSLPVDAPLSACRCSRRRNWSARSRSIARRCGRLPTSRSICSRILPRRPSSPSRTRGCLASCASRWISRRRRRKCLASSARRQAILRPVFHAMLENCDAHLRGQFRLCCSVYDGTALDLAAGGRSAPPRMIWRFLTAARYDCQPTAGSAHDHVVHDKTGEPDRTTPPRWRRHGEASQRSLACRRCSRMTLVGVHRHLPPGGSSRSPKSRSRWCALSPSRR